MAIKNFKRNAKRLTTHFDIYETLRDLSELDESSINDENVKRKSQILKEKTDEELPRGISLFLEVPEVRNCKSADIKSHWCMCHEKLELSNSNMKVSM